MGQKFLPPLASKRLVCVYLLAFVCKAYSSNRLGYKKWKAKIWFKLQASHVNMILALSWLGDFILLASLSLENWKVKDNKMFFVPFWRFILPSCTLFAQRKSCGVILSSWATLHFDQKCESLFAKGKPVKHLLNLTSASVASNKNRASLANLKVKKVKQSSHLSCSLIQ